MPKNILESVSRDLAEQVEKASDEEKRAICVPVCRLAIARTGLDEPLVEQALRLMENGIFKDQRVTTALERLFGDLDESYFAAEERYKAGQGTEDTYIALARKARAADAVLACFNDDAFIAATYSVYEVCAALGGADEVQAVVNSVLARKP